MSDYECPACGGGFPASAADDACPWCGEAMNGEPNDTSGRVSLRPMTGAPGASVPTSQSVRQRSVGGTTAPDNRRSMKDELIGGDGV